MPPVANFCFRIHLFIVEIQDNALCTLFAADSNLFLIVYRPVPSNIYNLPARAENQLILLSLALEKPNYNVGQRADAAGRAG